MAGSVEIVSSAEATSGSEMGAAGNSSGSMADTSFSTSSGGSSGSRGSPFGARGETSERTDAIPPSMPIHPDSSHETGSMSITELVGNSTSSAPVEDSFVLGRS